MEIIPIQFTPEDQRTVDRQLQMVRTFGEEAAIAFGVPLSAMNSMLDKNAVDARMFSIDCRRGELRKS